ncbi:MAG: hypothetical protein LW699_13180 [Pirellula sp.]|jgi:hypothetical protein|nr:hypothetical protein [Pirellula sp.]
MPIPVTCPGCLARFTVSDKYAGKQGPCPKCKQTITVPDKSQEVVIHVPENYGPKDAGGRPVLKPIKRVEFTPNGFQIVVAIGVAAVSIIAALWARLSGITPPTWALAFVAIALAYPLCSIGYTFFKDDELGGYIGKDRLVRLGICAGVFALTWGVYWLLASYFGNRVLAQVDTLQMSIFVLIMFGLGIAVSVGSCELEVGQSFLHYAIYFVATLLLAFLAGLPLAAPFSKDSDDAMLGLPKGSQKILLPTQPTNPPVPNTP